MFIIGIRRDRRLTFNGFGLVIPVEIQPINGGVIVRERPSNYLDGWLIFTEDDMPMVAILRQNLNSEGFDYPKMLTHWRSALTKPRPFPKPKLMTVFRS